jgi:hypothetical protein
MNPCLQPSTMRDRAKSRDELVTASAEAAAPASRARLLLPASSLAVRKTNRSACAAVLSDSRSRGRSTWATLERHGFSSVRVGHNARHHRLRAVSYAVGVSGLRRLDQLLIRSIAVALAGRGRCGRGKRGPHAFKEHGLAAVWIGRDVGGSRSRLILTAIRRRVLVGLNQLLVRPVVVGHARVCSTAPAVATRERAQRQPQIAQRGSPSPPTMNLIEYKLGGRTV